MKVGDLIYDETYGPGIVIGVTKQGARIVFEGDRVCYLGHKLFHTVEVINASR